MSYYEICINCDQVFPVEEGISVGFVTIYNEDGTESFDQVYVCSADCKEQYVGE